MAMLEVGETPVAGARSWMGCVPGRTLRHDERARQFGRFLIVGVANTVLSFVAYRLLVAVATPYMISAPLAFAVGATNGYAFNRRWTFAARDSVRGRALYVAVQAMGAVSTSLLVLLFVRAAGANKVDAYVAAIPPVTIATFIANRLWAFAERN